MIVLSADTTTPINTVSLLDDERLLAETVVHCGRKHSERLLETVDWVLKEAGLELSNVQLLAVSQGPGSFTGLRVGISAWKGLALALNLPLVGVPTLDAMSRLCPMYEGTVCTLLDAKMREVYGALFAYAGGHRSKLVDECVGPVNAILPQIPGGTIFVGDGATLYRAAILEVIPSACFAAPYHGVPRASAVAAEALALWQSGASGDAGAVNPVYLRQSQAEELREKAAVP